MTKARQRFSRISDKETATIGMITLGGIDYLGAAKKALLEAEVFIDAGCDAVLVTNYCKNTPAAKVVSALGAVKENFSGNGIKIGVSVFPNNVRKTSAIARQFDLDFVYFDYISGVYTKGPDFDSDSYFDFRRENPGVIVLGGIYPYGYIPVSGSDIERDIREGMRRADAVVVSGSSDSLAEKVRRFDKLMGRNKDARTERHPLVLFDPYIIADDYFSTLPLAEGVIFGSCVRNNNDPEAGINTRRLRAYIGNI